MTEHAKWEDTQYTTATQEQVIRAHTSGVCSRDGQPLACGGSANIYVVCLFLSHRTEACSALMLHSDKSVHV